VFGAGFEHVSQVLFLLDLAFGLGVFGWDAPRVEMDHVVPFKAFRLVAGCKGHKAEVFGEQNGKLIHKIGKGFGLFGLGHGDDALELVRHTFCLVGILIDFTRRKFTIFPLQSGEA